MSGYEKFYMESLYPLQDGILKAVADSGAPFYLTGGTALGRYHFGHRFSDDLDLFLNSDANFESFVEAALMAISSSAFAIDAQDFVRDRLFCRFSAFRRNTPDITIKLDFVNDTAPHFGPICSTALFSRVDGLRNILSNKIAALYRFEPKDAADIWVISRNARFRWKDIFAEAREKELGVEAPSAAEILASFPESYFESIKWREKPNPEEFISALRRIAREILEGDVNSLAAPDSAEL